MSTSNQLAERAVEVMQYSRAQDTVLLLAHGHRTSVNTVAEVLRSLPVGAYLLGCGPYVCGLFPLTTEEIVLGRPASPLEKPADTVTDYQFNDAVFLVPREISRVHATILRTFNEEESEYHFSVRDESSTTGTFINGERVSDQPQEKDLPNPAQLTNGDVLQLGPSSVNSYLFVEVEESDGFD